MSGDVESPACQEGRQGASGLLWLALPRTRPACHHPLPSPPLLSSCHSPPVIALPRLLPYTPPSLHPSLLIPRGSPSCFRASSGFQLSSLRLYPPARSLTDRCHAQQHLTWRFQKGIPSTGSSLSTCPYTLALHACQSVECLSPCSSSSSSLPIGRVLCNSTPLFLEPNVP